MGIKGPEPRPIGACAAVLWSYCVDLLSLVGLLELALDLV